MVSIILAHQIGISVVFTRGKDKKASRRPRAGRTSIRDVIVKLKLRHHVACQRIQDFLEIFSYFPI